MSTVQFPAVLLLSPVFPFLTAIAIEALIDLVLEVGVPAILDVMAAGAIVWVLLRQHGARPGVGLRGELRSGSHVTPCWREVDSNSQSRQDGDGFEPALVPPLK